jgi:hypothetical protein
MALSEDAEIRPGQRLTAHLSAWFGEASTLKAEIVRVFSGTIFPVDQVSIPALVGTFAFTGVAQSQHGLGTTLPGRNITVAEFRGFVNQRLSLASGALGLEATTIEDGGITEVPLIGSVSDVVKPYLYLALILVGLGLLGYAAFGVSRLVRG